jgi:hypothetical protein
MTYTDVYKQSVLNEAKETLKRTSPESLAKTRLKYADQDSDVIYTQPVEDRVERWKREADELEERRIIEKERLSMISRLHESTIRCQQDIAAGLSAVGKLAEAIEGRLDRIDDAINELRTKFKVAEIRHEDLKRSFDSRTSDISSAISVSEPGSVVDLKPRRA